MSELITKEELLELGFNYIVEGLHTIKIKEKIVIRYKKVNIEGMIINNGMKISRMRFVLYDENFNYDKAIMDYIPTKHNAIKLIQIAELMGALE